MMKIMKLLLASSSSYRKQQLAKLGIAFDTFSPDIDETPLPSENPVSLTTRLARNKARAAVEQYPGHRIIGSDQVASLDGRIMGKPHTVQNAVEQLMCCCGRKVTFYTGLCLLNPVTGHEQTISVPFSVFFRHLSEQQIRRYVQLEKPLDCAGSFKCEELGIALFSKMEGDDPSSLVGLPLIQLNEMLFQEGVDVLRGA
ncbi:Maf-like protein YceF [invertebrate metagenome]|uniref:Maf-like protein YceF n=1 Tax=invertebrate metagenome TaxID=1711999 RepID=A0A2H9T8I9_9ZZZZ